jgi:hypothetical protein
MESVAVSSKRTDTVASVLEENLDIIRFLTLCGRGRHEVFFVVMVLRKTDGANRDRDH